MAHKEFAYTVRGHWPFPLDMLRYDQSRAASSEDQDMIDRHSMEHAPDRAAFLDMDIHLVGPCKPNSARWESFGWQVPTDRDHQFYKAARKHDLEERAAFDAAMAKLSATERNVILARIGHHRP